MRRIKLVALLVMVTIFSMIFATTVLAGDINNSKLLPSDKVMVFEDGKKTATYTREMPVPEGLDLKCEGKCAIKLDNMSLVAEDQSVFSIYHKNSSRVLDVKEGTVYFGASDQTNTLVFLTPKGAAVSEQIMINASSSSRLLEGYVKVTDETSEVGVIRNGSMTLATRDESRHIKSGQSLILAQANLGAGGGQGGGTAGSANSGISGWWQSLSTTGKIGTAIAGASGLGITAAGINAASDDNKTRDASPSTP
jgi:hypothetical protein